MYSDKEWRALERLQNLTKSIQGKNLRKLIENFQKIESVEASKLRIVDLGCGTGNIIIEALDELGPIQSYTGFDISSVACKILKKRDLNAFNTKIVQECALRGVLLSEAEVYISLSNSLLSFGSENELSKSVKFALENQKKLGIFSFVPWDKNREDWHNNFKNWISLEDKDGFFEIRSESREKNGRIEQKLFYREKSSKERDLIIEHSFLKMKKSEITDLFKDSGIKIHQWINPMTLEREDPENSMIPEFWAICRSEDE